MSLYNTTTLDNATNILQVMQAVGTAAGDSFLIGNLLLLGFFLCFSIASLRYDFKEVMLVDAFLSTTLSILLYAAGLIAAPTISFPAILFFVMLVLYFLVDG